MHAYILFCRTGNIFLLGEKPLDRERTQRYVLIVQARDNGKPNPRTSNVSGLCVVNKKTYLFHYFGLFCAVEILIDDINDNRPRFSQPEYRVSVNESAYGPLLHVEATDADQESNLRFALDIVVINK